MPIIYFTMLLGAVLGYTVERRVALTITAIVGVLAVGSFVWAVADDNGDDPAWIIAVAVAGVAVAIAIAALTSWLRARRA